MSVKEMVVVMTFSVMVWKALGLIWKTERLDASCCEGQDKILTWNFSLETNETVQTIQWFFNKTEQIAYASESIEFLVSSGYKSRVERKGITEILLKNVSSLDAGEYTLHPNLATEQTENIQSIFLTVYESPRYQCKPNITVHDTNVIFCSTNSCGGIQLSTEWRIWGKSDPVSNESHLKINSSWNAVLVLCCLHIPNSQCHNGDIFDFCASTAIFFSEDKNCSEFNTDSKCTEHNVGLAVALTVAGVSVIYIISFVALHGWNRIKKCNLCEQQNANPEEHHNRSEENKIMLQGVYQKANSEEEGNGSEENLRLLQGENQNANRVEQGNRPEENPKESQGECQKANPEEEVNGSEENQRMLRDEHQNGNTEEHGNISDENEIILRDNPGRSTELSSGTTYFDAIEEVVPVNLNRTDEEVENFLHEAKRRAGHGRYDCAFSIEPGFAMKADAN